MKHQSRNFVTLFYIFYFLYYFIFIFYIILLFYYNYFVCSGPCYIYYKYQKRLYVSLVSLAGIMLRKPGDRL